METINKFTYHGTVADKTAVKTYPSGFRRCDFACMTKSGEYVNYAVFSVTGDRTDAVKELNKGDEVTVEFVLDGRQYEKNGEVSWFGGAKALKITAEARATPTPATPNAQAVADEADAVAEDLPF